MHNHFNIENLLQPYIARSRKTPELAHLIALDFDATLKHKLKASASITFSSIGLKIGQNPPKTHGIFSPDNLLEKNHFQNTPVIATNGLNLHYANKLIHNKKLWLHFTKKYLFPLKIIQTQEKHQLFPIKIVADQKNEVDKKVTVIMTAFNAEKTIQAAVESILNQTHSNIELIIINDCSNDNTAEEINKIKNKDTRVITQSNKKNLGAYVSRNIAIGLASGDYITCHDADDYAFPNRIEVQLNSILENSSHASICHMLRMKNNGEITRFSKVSSNSPDGWKKLCHISMMYESKFFKKNLGHWDSVKAAGDSEIINRTIKATKNNITTINDVLLLALDTETSTTRNQEIGLFSLQGQETRRKYKEQWRNWHETTENLYIPFPIINRPFPAPSELI